MLSCKGVYVPKWIGKNDLTRWVFLIIYFSDIRCYIKCCHVKVYTYLLFGLHSNKFVFFCEKHARSLSIWQQPFFFVTRHDLACLYPETLKATDQLHPG